MKILINLNCGHTATQTVSLVPSPYKIMVYNWLLSNSNMLFWRAALVDKVIRKTETKQTKDAFIKYSITLLVLY